VTTSKRGGRGHPARPKAAENRSLGGEQIEGRRAVRELLAAGRRPVRDVWLSDTVEDSPLVAEICELAAHARVAVRRVARARLDAEARTDAPQGILAHARALEPVELETLCRTRRGGSKPFLLALDGVTDPQNLGALLRTAEVAGVTGVVLPRHRAVHVTPTVAKAAAGAVEYLPIALVPGLAAAMVTLQSHGVWTVGLDPEAPESLFGLALASEAVAIVLGAEGAGLSRLVRQRCDVRRSIPQSGLLGSLNVATAGALGLFEVARGRQEAGPAGG
jgi:23S rRNA (guanosine2251-2'-O)-methyltransferase